MVIDKFVRVKILIVLTILMFIAEICIGFFTRSMALVTDSFHMLSDVMALLIANYTMKLAKQEKPSVQHTFGWQRAETIGALINSTFLLALCFTIVVSAIQRFIEPIPIREPLIVLIVGCAGLLVNCIGLFLFHDHENSHSHDHHSQHSKLNMKAVFLHVLGDALGSVGVIISAIIVEWTQWSLKYYVDPAVSLIIAIIIVCTTIPLFRKTTGIVLHIVPDSIPIDILHNEIKKIPYIYDIHEFHVWQLSDHKTIASIHLVINQIANSMDTISAVKKVLHDFNIHSTTIQLENYLNNNEQIIDIEDIGDEPNQKEEQNNHEFPAQGRNLRSFPPKEGELQYCMVKCFPKDLCENLTCCKSD